MKKKLSVIPLKASDSFKDKKSDNWQILKNRFAGERLFRYNYFNLLNQDFSILENTKNEYFLKQILEAGSEGDQNMFSALKKLASYANIDAKLCTHASEIAESLAVKNKLAEQEIKKSVFLSDEDRIYDARQNLAGTRRPQTTEILRLLREKSTGHKRIALYMIGKFRLKDMISDVCECLNIPGMEEDAIAVLKVFGVDASNELRRLFLKSAGNINTCKIIIRLLGRYNTDINRQFIFERLWSGVRTIRENALNCLVNSDFEPSEQEKIRLNKLIIDQAETLIWLLSAKVTAAKQDNKPLCKTLDSEFLRWRSFLSGVAAITFSQQFPEYSGKKPKSHELEAGVSVSYILNILFDDSNKNPETAITDYKGDEKRLKKLRKVFPLELPDYYQLAEDIINFDYNIISIWTKACTLRYIPAIKKEDSLFESVIALLFSAEEMLQEEAVKLLSRSGRDDYLSASQRIPAGSKARLDKIASGQTDERDYHFEKIKFLSSLFSSIPEDELMFLAGRLKYVSNLTEKAPLYTEGSVNWILSGENTADMVIINHPDEPAEARTDTTSDGKRYYALELKDIEAFHHQFPERAFEILKYIDDNEKPVIRR